MTNNTIGFGDSQFTLAVYIGNQPDMPDYRLLNRLIPMRSGEIELIGKTCGNGWRKVFNVYAKLLYALDDKHFDLVNRDITWQTYRDEHLLQKNSRTALIFSYPNLSDFMPSILVNRFHIICGRTYAKKLINEGHLLAQLHWFDEEFAVDLQQKVIVCPYFDYRQLSNEKINRLSVLLSHLVTQSIR
ncbi:hypothetical protein N8878_06305 [Psychromonas sp.]|nr:hypothetical protein [Psychromonas sp.]